MDLVELKNYFDPEPVEICLKLQSEGYDAVIVGGPVRDMLLGHAPHDVDIASNAPTSVVRNLFPRTFIQGKGEVHGTIGVVGASGEKYEVTQYRKDIETDGRHAKVLPADTVEEDLLRRDLTINAIALRPRLDGTGEIIDPFCGRRDLERGQIRTVGEASERFREDYLRVLRAYRFAARFDFELSESLRSALKAAAPNLQHLSSERIREELMKLMSQSTTSGGLFKILKHMAEDGIFEYILPEVARARDITQNEHHAYDVQTHLFASAEAASSENPLLRFGMLIHDIGKPDTREVQESGKVTFYGHEDLGAELASRLAERLTFSNKEKAYLVSLVKNHMWLLAIDGVPKPSTLRRKARKLAHESDLTLKDLLTVRIADKLGSGLSEKQISAKYISEYLEQVEKMHTEKQALEPRDLVIGGKAVMEILNVTPGPIIGQVLNTLLEEVLEDPSKNNEEYLIERVRELGENQVALSPPTPKTSSRSR